MKEMTVRKEVRNLPLTPEIPGTLELIPVIQVHLDLEGISRVHIEHILGKCIVRTNAGFA